MIGGDLVAGDGVGLDVSQLQLDHRAAADPLEDVDAGGDGIAAQCHFLEVEDAAHRAVRHAAGADDSRLGGGDRDQLVLHAVGEAGGALQLDGAPRGEEDLDGAAFGQADGGGTGLGSGLRHAGHVAVRSEKQDYRLAHVKALDGFQGALQDGELVSQHRDLLGRSGVGLGALVDAGQPQVGDDQLVGHAVVGDHVIGLDIGHGDGLAVLLDGVVGRAAGELVEHGLGGGAGDHHRVSGGAGGAIVQAHHLAVCGVQGHLAAGTQLQIQLLIGGHRVFLGRGIGRGVAVDVVPGAVGACEIGGLGGAGQGHGDGGGLVGEEGDDAVLVVQHQHAPASLKGGGHHALLRREIGPIRGADGALGIVVLRGGVGVQ